MMYKSSDVLASKIYMDWKLNQYSSSYQNYTLNILKKKNGKTTDSFRSPWGAT